MNSNKHIIRLLLVYFVLVHSPVLSAQRTAVSIDSIRFNPVPLLTSSCGRQESTPHAYHPSRNSNTPAVGSTVQLQPISGDYAVGQIPFQEGVTPTGGKTISVPIMSASIPGAPSVSLEYNSQRGNSVAGWGWGIGGLSTMVSGNKTIFYDGEPGAPASSVSSNNAIRYLDGIRLLDNTNASMFGFPWETSKGFSYISTYSTNTPSFQVLHPDGSSAIYGEQTGAIQTNYVIQSHLDPLGYRTVYEYFTDNGTAFIQRITYGSDDSSSCPGEIRFSYTTRNDTIRKWGSGQSSAVVKILQTIESYYKGDLLRRYELSHGHSSTGYILSRIDCYNSEDEQLPPLLFSYGDPNGNNSQTLSSTQGMLLRYFSSSDTLHINHLRGKFLLGSYSDGLVSYPQFSTYTPVVTITQSGQLIGYIYGSGYASDQELLIYHTLGEWSNPLSITAGDGFLGVFAVDIDGDGFDELIKTNYSETTSVYTRLTWTVYRINPLSVQQLWSDVISIPGSNNVGDYYSPYPVRILPGDYDGDGRSEFLVITGDDFSNVSSFHYVTLTANHIAQSQSLSAPFNASLNSLQSLVCMDLDGDGRGEMIYGSSIFRVSNSGISLLRNEPGLTTEVFLSGMIGDVNGDGLTDFLHKSVFNDLYPASMCYVWRPHICPICGAEHPLEGNNVICRNCSTLLVSYYQAHPEEASCYICGLPLSESLSCPQHGYFVNTTNSQIIWKQLINTGNGFLDEVCNGWPSGLLTENGTAQLQDVNHDGLADIIYVDNSYFRVIINVNGGFWTTPADYIHIPSGAELVLLNSVRPEKQSGVCAIKDESAYYLSWNRDERVQHTLTQFTDSFGNLHFYNYEDLEQTSFYTESDSTFSYPNYKYRFPLLLLVNETHAQNGGFVSGSSYQYEDAVLNKEGLGFLCFGKTSTTDMVSNLTCSEKRDARLLGMTTEVLTPFSRSQYQWSYPTTGNNSRKFRIDSAIETDLMTGIVKNLAFTYDCYNEPISTTMTYANSGSSETTTVTYSNMVSPSRYRLGLPYVTEVTRSRGNDIWIDRTVMTYSTQKELPIHRWTYTGSNGQNKTEETVWTYDSHGNVLTQQTKPFNSDSSLIASFSYSSDGLDLCSESTPDGLVTQYAQHNRYKAPLRTTDPLGNSQQYEYDLWGNPIRVLYATGATDSTFISWGGYGLYTVEKRISGKPITRVHYDAAGREIRSEIKRFNGQWQKTDKEYDSRGRLYRTSQPFRGNSATLWNTLTYDIFNRPILLTSASGNARTWVYDGLKTTETINGVSSTKTYDDTGMLIYAEDSGGIIHYTYRADGKPLTVSVPRSFTISISYDPYGRRLSISDPSAGIQKDTLTYLSDGSSILSHTNPKGQITSYIDRYGRTTRIERQNAFYTDYTYDTFGRLTNASSSNGTARFYTYDSYGRVGQETETAATGVSLTKEYTYNTGDALASVRYLSSLSLDITENFAYTNGWNTATTLSGGQSIFQLLAEDDFGNPTMVQTGAVLREYGFTSTGLPTYRKMNEGLIQDFHYTFDPQTGNLLSRGDSLHHHSELFGYDELDRLISVRTDGATESEVMTYDQKGNITEIGGVSSMSYGRGTHAFQMTRSQPASIVFSNSNTQVITYTSFMRPSSIKEVNRELSFGYNDNHDRVWMREEIQDTLYRTKYYLGGCYEAETALGETVEKVYLCGGYYDSPMVYVTSGTSNGALQNIGRDYLGSVTHITTAAGALIDEYSYDAWGNRRDPITFSYLSASSSFLHPLILGRGYTGHEHLELFSLINMNARLYDPTVGRFLSPDPFIQAPDFSQGLNRYSYALNNPLKYTDENGEVAWFIPLIYAAVEGSINLYCNWSNIDNFGEGIAVFLGGAASGAISAFNPAVGAAVGGLLTGGINEAVKQTNSSTTLSEVDWGIVIGKAAFQSIANYASQSVLSILNKTNPISKLIKNRPYASSIAGSIVYTGTDGLISGVITDIGDGIVLGKWNSFGNGALSGLLAGSIAGGSMSGSYLLGNKLFRKQVSPSLVEDLLPSIGDLSGKPLESILAEGLVLENYSAVVSFESLKKTLVYTFVPSPILGASPIQNVYEYPHFDRIYDILKRLHF